jgi:hypothetical protein
VTWTRTSTDGFGANTQGIGAADGCFFCPGKLEKELGAVSPPFRSQLQTQEAHRMQHQPAAIVAELDVPRLEPVKDGAQIIADGFYVLKGLVQKFFGSHAYSCAAQAASRGVCGLVVDARASIK